MANEEDTDYTSDDSYGPFVPARIKGPLFEQIQEQAMIICKDFDRCVATFLRKKRERPNEDPAKLYYEEPFHSDAIEVQNRLMEENKELIRLSGEELEHKWEPRSSGIPVITVAEEARTIAALERKWAREERRKRKGQEWNPDQKKSQKVDNEPPRGHNKPRYNPDAKVKQGESSKYIPPKEGGGCTSCLGPCVLDSRRSLMSCTNEPMLPELMADLLGQFYRLGWMTGSGGAMAAISCDNRLLLSPSSLQKERIKACDLFASPPNTRTVRTPTCMPNGKPTACEGIFKMIMQASGAQCVIHSHSKASNLVTRLPSNGGFWAISGQEYIKGIYNFRTKQQMQNDDILLVPIFQNAPTEEDLEPQVERLIESPQFDQYSAFLVQNHGVFVWGPTWQKTKIMAEIYEYLFDLSVDLVKMGQQLVSQVDLARAVMRGQFTNGTPPTPEQLRSLAEQQAQAALQAQTVPAVPAEPTAPTAPVPSFLAPTTPSAPPAEE